MLSKETVARTRPGDAPERRGPFDKQDSGIRERVAEEDRLYQARESAMLAYQTIVTSIQELIRTIRKEMPLDADASAILDRIEQFPSQSSPLYDHIHGRSAATIFAEPPDENGHRIWSALSQLTFQAGLKRKEAYDADAAAHAHDQRLRAAQKKIRGRRL